MKPTSPAVAPKRRGLLALVALIVVGLAAALAVVFINRDSPPSSGTGSSTPPTADNAVPVGTTTVATSTTVSDDALHPDVLGAGEVLLEPVGFDLADSFSDSAAIGVEAAPAVSPPVLPVPTTAAPLPADQVALAQVPGGQPGLYGGTRDVAACDRDAMTSFLEANPDKAAAWAAVQSIAPSTIGDYISRLTPVVLTKDTRVTNHGFRNGRAQPHPSVLQAGHAVLVDEFGVPRAKCSCGNPLLPPLPLASTPSYVGPGWSSFSTTTIIVVIATVAVTDGFVIVDLTTGTMIVRPVGFAPGAVDTPVAAEAMCDLFPGDPSCTPKPIVDPVELVNIGNSAAIVPGATASPSFTVDGPTLVTYIQTYHYGSGSAPGQIGLLASDGSFYGPFQATGLEGQGGVANAFWVVEPNAVIPAGAYTVWDSEPSTWSTNTEAGMVGFAVAKGVLGVDLPATAPGAQPPQPPATIDDAAQTIIDMLLLDCGYDVTDWIDGGPVDNGWVWTAVVAGVQRTFVVNDPFGAFSVDVRDQAAADLAVACGFYQP